MLEEVYNFGAGPGVLPVPVKQIIHEQLFDWVSGMSVMEVSHRHNKFLELTEHTDFLLRKLLNIPINYKILFLQGGARAQFSMIPLNLIKDNCVGNYLVTGFWSQLAAQDATSIGEVSIVNKIAENGFTEIPDLNKLKIDDNAAYLHYTDNESIHGIEFKTPPEVNLPLISDMTSNILSKPLDISKYKLIYASTQKNLGIAGLTLVIIDEDLVDKLDLDIPVLQNYKKLINAKSMLNTPPTFAWYVTNLVLQWIDDFGGIDVIAKHNDTKANRLYSCIDNSNLYVNTVKPEFRSRMNVPFCLKDRKLEEKFISESAKQGLQQLAGHRILGGIRASIYNAMPMSGVESLIKFMQEFELANHY